MWPFGQCEPAARMYITLDKSAYVAGEIVRGRVALAVYRDIVADGLTVQIRGHERISWTKLVTEHHKTKGSHTREQTCTRTNAFLDDRIVLFVFPRALAPGNYEFTFAYEAHASLPGAFAFDDPMTTRWRECHTNYKPNKHKHKHKHKHKPRDLRATISYSVHATLDEGRWFRCYNTHARSDLAIHERPRALAVRPSSCGDTDTDYCDVDYSGTYGNTTQTVRRFALLRQGSCDVAAWLAKPVYAAGETVTLQYRITNQSHAAICRLRVELVQDVELQRKKRRSDSIEKCVAIVECAGVAAQSDVTSCVTLALVHAADGRVVAPTTTGALVRCSYRLRLTCDIAYSPDVWLDLPVVIASPIAALTAAAPLATPVSVAVGVPLPVAVPVDEVDATVDAAARAGDKRQPTAPLEDATALDDSDAVRASTVRTEGSRFQTRFL